MCLLFFSWRDHPTHRLILASNRDEFYSRPTLPAAFWEEAPEVLGGRDLQGRGTWLGLTLRGRFAALTNFRQRPAGRTGTPSRGQLVSRYLLGAEGPLAYLDGLRETAPDYEGFNLLTGDPETCAYFSNRNGSARSLEPGRYVLSNAVLDTPWPKVNRAREGFTAWLAGASLREEELFELLAETRTFPDESLPDTGVGLEMERVLSPLRVVTPIYGTRASTLIFVSWKNEAVFVEKTLDPPSGAWTQRRFEFPLH